MQHVIHAAIAPRLLNRRDVRRLLHHTNQPLITHRARAIPAWIDIGDVVAHRAKPQMRLQLPNRFRKLLSIIRRSPQHMKRQPLSALRPNPRQLPELIDQPSHRLRKPRHQRNPGKSGRPSPPIIPATLVLIASSARRPASFTAAVIKSSSSSRSLPALPIADGSIFSRRTSFFPFIRTVTTPPPLDASTTVSDSLRSICSCIWRACPIISFIFPRSEKSMRSSSPSRCPADRLRY